MKNQNIRNLTTFRLHTCMDDIYKDIEYITGTSGIMTHQLPNAGTALQPWLKEKIKDERFWDGQYDPTHKGSTRLKPMTTKERDEFWKRFHALRSPL